MILNFVYVRYELTNKGLQLKEVAISEDKTVCHHLTANFL
jgi:hypothetical protein